MKLLRCEVKNFGSYNSLAFDFNNSGLTLIHGATGSGKSTLMDVACWILYGVTAKDGNVDEVRSWSAPDEATEGSISVELSDGIIIVSRKRGKSNENDLYWTEGKPDSGHNRGKDISDTQKLIETRLGVSSDSFLTSAYFHEFSNTGAFFSAKSKDRRQVFEQIAPLGLPDRLATNASNARKLIKGEISQQQKNKDHLSGKILQLKDTIGRTEKTSKDFGNVQQQRLRSLQEKSEAYEVLKASQIKAFTEEAERFEVDRIAKRESIREEALRILQETRQPYELDEQIEELKLKGVCTKCRSFSKEVNQQLLELNAIKIQNTHILNSVDQMKKSMASLLKEPNPYINQVRRITDEKNPYPEMIAAERERANQAALDLENLTELYNSNTHVFLELEKDIKRLEHRYNSLTQLYDMSYDLRGELLKKTVREIESSTNDLLTRHFDAELRVTFSVSGSDNLDVGIHKSGNPCVYKQLSKGQRQLLKLSFSISIMKASANKVGVNFDSLFFDEALDGLDTDLKVKAFSIFEELEKDHGSVFLIDHAPEFQNLFSKRYHVQMVQDCSTIMEDHE